MSSPNFRGEDAYRYRAVYVFLPRRIAEDVGARTRFIQVQISRPVVREELAEPATQVLRRARCRIPDSDEAERLVRWRLGQVPVPAPSWEGTLGQIGPEAVPESIAVRPAPRPRPKSGEVCYSWKTCTTVCNSRARRF